MSGWLSDEFVTEYEEEIVLDVNTLADEIYNQLEEEIYDQ